MASLRDEARPYLDDFRDAIQWLALWKTGRGWNIRLMWNTEYTEGSTRWNEESKWEIDEEDQEELRSILAQDPNACLINGYYLNIGPINEQMTLGTLIDGLRFQYEGGGNLKDVLAACEAQKAKIEEGSMNNELPPVAADGGEYIQIGVTALRDPKTGDFLPSVPLFIRAEDKKRVPQAMDCDMRALAKMLAEKMKQYVDGCRAAGIKI